MDNNSVPLIDIGSNLLDKQLLKNFNTIIDKSKRYNIKNIIITSSHINDTHKAKELIDKEPSYLYTTVGFHPHNAKDYQDKYYSQMKERVLWNYELAGINPVAPILKKTSQRESF